MVIAPRQRCAGVTLIELIAVLALSSILLALGTRFLLTVIDSYSAVQTRSQLINRGRLAMEQMVRQLRSAVPNSVRVSATGNCIEFLPAVVGAHYLNELPDSENLAPAITSIATLPATRGGGTPTYAIVGALDSSEIYASGSPSVRANLGILFPLPLLISVPLASPHRFLRNSTSQRIYLAARPLRFCLFGTDLVQYSNYGLVTTPLTDLDPGGNSDVMATRVATPDVAFAVSPGTEDRNTALTINLIFTQGTQSVDLRQQLLVRNVP